MMFAGPHLEPILAAYEEAVRLFSEIRDPAELLKRLQASADVQKVYESRLSDGKVSIVMRDAMFRKPGALEHLEFKLRILAGKNALYSIRCRSRASAPSAIFFHCCSAIMTKARLRRAFARD